MHPSASSPAFDVARWIAGVSEAGIINITGNVRMVDPTGTGSVSFDIFVDGTSIFTTLVNSTVGVSFNQTWTVGIGSTVDFSWPQRF